MNPPLAQMFDGMQYIPLMLLLLAASTLLGLAAILFALLRDQHSTIWLSYTCLALSVTTTVVWLVLIGDNLSWAGYGISLSPALLALAALLSHRVNREKPTIGKN